MHEYPPTSDSSDVPTTPPGSVTGDESSHEPTVLPGGIDPATVSDGTPGLFVCAVRHYFHDVAGVGHYVLCTRRAGHGGAQHVATVTGDLVVATWSNS